jgi:7,8-dihydropterin-6-yl-methyl-4-(beta-D-ribofuranosyl)aminobenzene 5'-phosphate synthase
MISSLTLSVLCDNHALRFFPAEWGFSLFIQGSRNVLLDCGASDLFVRNARRLGLDLSAADACVLSHGHWDHGDGLAYLPACKLFCHPDAFIRRYNGERYVGLSCTREQAAEKFDLILSGEPFWLDDDTVFLGEIPRRNDFEAQTTVFSDAEGRPDFVRDDSAVAVKTDRGLVVISGCAHAGICNTVAYAMEVTGQERVYAVLGGFHLKGDDDLTAATIAWLGEADIEIIRATHCTQFRALVQLADRFGSSPMASGELIRL